MDAAGTARGCAATQTATHRADDDLIGAPIRTAMARDHEAYAVAAHLERAATEAVARTQCASERLPPRAPGTGVDPFVIQWLEPVMADLRNLAGPGHLLQRSRISRHVRAQLGDLDWRSAWIRAAKAATKDLQELGAAAAVYAQPSAPSTETIAKNAGAAAQDGGASNPRAGPVITPTPEAASEQPGPLLREWSGTPAKAPRIVARRVAGVLYVGDARVASPWMMQQSHGGQHGGDEAAPGGDAS